MKITTEQIEAGRALRALDPPWGWDRMAMHLGVSYYALRSELEPAYRVRRMQSVRMTRAKRAENPRGPKRKYVKRDEAERIAARAPVTPPLSIPKDVLMDRDRRMSAPRSITAILMGDPEPGRRRV
jgi:hypothetical protein